LFCLETIVCTAAHVAAETIGQVWDGFFDFFGRLTGF
jgi:hypothetical protein